MKTSRFLTSIILLITVTVAAQGQNDRYVATGRAMHADDTAIVRGQKGVGWVRSHFFDDWFIQVQGGGQLFYGFDDTEGPFKDRLTGIGEISIGRRIFPMFGFRANLGYGYAHGFLKREHYDPIIIDYGLSGRSGNDEAGNPLGGYYWVYDDNLLIQKWKYHYMGLDLFIDMDLFRGSDSYNPEKLFNNILYAGFNTKFAHSETDTVNHRSEAHIGYICKCNINQNWSITADFRGSMVERLFDREWVPKYEKVYDIADFIFSVQVGVTYKFHIRTPEERDIFVVTDEYEEKNATIQYITYFMNADTFQLHVVDTLLKYRQVNNPTPRTRIIIDSLQNHLDSALLANKQRVWNQPLDSILLNNLLPYEMIFFEKDRWDITPTEEMKIEKMARIMKAYPTESFILTGSADSKTGTPYRNDFLSHNRADVVYNILVEEYGIEPERLKREYLGGILEYQPFQLNRCTVIIMDHPTVKAAFESMKQTGKK